MTDCEERLRQEREKLDRLVDEALASGTPIDQTYDIMSQCRKVKRMAGAGRVLQAAPVRAQARRVEKLIERVEREREKVHRQIRGWPKSELICRRSSQSSIGVHYCVCKAFGYKGIWIYL